MTMHFTEPVYRNPYWPTWPLLEVTRGCTHNKCKFCTMYKGVKFGVPTMETIEEDLRELAATVPHAREHAISSAKVFSQTNPMVVGTGGLTLFPGTPLLDEANRGEFDPLSEREMLEEVLLFVENLTCDCTFITHYTIGGENLTGPDFLGRKDAIIAALRDQIDNGDLEGMARVRAMKRSL